MTYEYLALDHLRVARLTLIDGRDNGRRASRELNIALTEMETAIMWLEKDVETKERRTAASAKACSPKAEVR